MSKYFDKKFWKMLSGFITILAVSALIIFSTKVYQQGELQKENTATVIYSDKQ